MNKRLSFKKCLDESLKDYNKCSDEVHSVLSKLWDKYKEVVAVEDFVDIVNNWMLDASDRHVEESYRTKVECIHSEYDDEFEESSNYYDVETAHEFIGLDDTAPKARKFTGEIEEIDYDDRF